MADSDGRGIRCARCERTAEYMICCGTVAHCGECCGDDTGEAVCDTCWDAAESAGEVSSAS